MVVQLKGFPCKVIEVTTSMTGEHGDAEVNITGFDILTNKKYTDISPASHDMVAPFVHEFRYTLTDINEGFVSLMDENGETREDLKLPEGELGDTLNRLFTENDEEINCIVTKVMEREIITSCKMAYE